MAEAPRIYEVNGYGVFEIRPGPVFKVYDSDRQYGGFHQLRRGCRFREDPSQQIASTGLNVPAAGE